MTPPIITFLSDYGYQDDFVGVCHGVIATICPEARVIDITHGLPRHDVMAGALILRNVLPYMPVGVHIGVVDPDVGAERRAIALRVADERVLVGPDNGLLSLAAASGGGIVEAVDIGRSPFRLATISATFHGRDVFAPVAARLAGGAAFGDAGPALDPDELIAVKLPRAQRHGDSLIAHVLYIDRFGNVVLNVGHDDLANSGLKLGHQVGLRIGSWTVTAQYARTFADVRQGELLVYEDAYRMLALAVSGDAAATRLGLAPGRALRITPA
jgi:S-adenosylmethionine hydrolase